jgi:very-short-patch-repair endonuclease
LQTDKTKDTIITGQKPGGKHQVAQLLRRKQTPAELALWYHLRSNRLDGLQFRRQQVIDGFIADFYCHAIGLVIEVDGMIHESQSDYDAERDRILRERGLAILRFTNDQIMHNRAAVLETIREFVRSRSKASKSESSL